MALRQKSLEIPVLSELNRYRNVKWTIYHSLHHWYHDIKFVIICCHSLLQAAYIDSLLNEILTCIKLYICKVGIPPSLTFFYLTNKQTQSPQPPTVELLHCDNRCTCTEQNQEQLFNDDTATRGVTRLDGAGARSKFGFPMFAPEWGLSEANVLYWRN